MKQYEVEPTEALWRDTLFHADWQQAEAQGWECHAGWRGYEIGSYPYSMYFSRQHGEGYEVVKYVERDVNQYEVPDLDTFRQLMDALAWEQWQFDYRANRYDFSFMEGLTSIEQVPYLQDYPAPKDYVVFCWSDEDHQMHLLDGPTTEAEAKKIVAQLNSVEGTNAILSHIKGLILPQKGSDIVKMNLKLLAEYFRVEVVLEEEPAKEAGHANE